MGSLLRHPQARLWVIGQAFSGLGDSALWLALAIWVKTLTGSSSDAGLVMFFFSAAALVSPALGVYVDRARRSRVLVATNLAGAAVILPLLAVHDRHALWLIYVVMFGYGAINKLIGSAQSALLADILPTDLLAPANAALQSSREALRIAAPLIGAGLYVWLGPGAVVVLDAVTFLAAAGCVAALRIREAAPERVDTALRHEIAAGARYIAARPLLRWLVVGFGVAAFAYGFNESGIFSVVGEGLHLPPAFVGITGMVQGGASVLIGPIAGLLNRRLGELRLVRIGLAGYAASLVLLLMPSLPALLVSMAVAGVSLPLAGVGLYTCIQVSTPQRLQGRVFSATDLATSIPMALSVAIGTGLLGLFGYRALFGVGAAILLAGATVTLLTRASGSVAPEDDVTPQRVPV